MLRRINKAPAAFPPVSQITYFILSAPQNTELQDLYYLLSPVPIDDGAGNYFFGQIPPPILLYKKYVRFL